MKSPYWYLSFVDTSAEYTPEGDYPGGPRWRGGCYVPGIDIVTAASAAWAFGCNPGGEVKAWGPFDGDRIPDTHKHRLLTAAEIDEMEVLP